MTDIWKPIQIELLEMKNLVILILNAMDELDRKLDTAEEGNWWIGRYF